MQSSPSFNRCSSNTLEDVAARVIQELRSQPDYDYFDDVFGLEIDEPPNDTVLEEDDEFEFPSVRVASIPADEIFSNGQIRPMYPVFGREYIFLQNKKYSYDNNNLSERLPLWKLMSEERETATVSASSSSSEADDLDGVPPETYCEWTPAAAGCKKSRSAGRHSRRWKIRDLLFRSNSDGKDTFVFLSHPTYRGRKTTVEGGGGDVAVEEGGERRRIGVVHT